MPFGSDFRSEFLYSDQAFRSIIYLRLKLYDSPWLFYVFVKELICFRLHLNIRSWITDVRVRGQHSSHLFNHVASLFLFFDLQFFHVDIEPIIEGFLFNFELWYEISSNLLHVIEITTIGCLYVALVVLLAVVVGSFQVHLFRYFASLWKRFLSLI